VDLKGIISAFGIEDEVTAERYGGGHINDTYKVTVTGKDEYYVLQRINDKVFPDVEGLMNNIVLVTGYIREKIRAGGGDAERTLRVLPSKDGRPYIKTAEGYFRLYNFIRGAISVESSPTERQFYNSGVGYGRFQKYLDGFDASLLVEPIKDFHNTEDRYKKFLKAIENDAAGRLREVLPEVEFYRSREKYASVALELIRKGEIPLRVTHNDTKLNNMLLDVKSGSAVTAIDLDTVMPGSVIYDFGDSIRSGAGEGDEDERDLSKVRFSIRHFAAFSEGFLGEVKDVLTPAEKENTAFGGILMTYECGMRFLTDHLNGDVYFKVHREGHNLDRARTQMKLVSDMERELDAMREIVRKYAR